MQLQKCTMIDVPKLALLNKQLIGYALIKNTNNPVYLRHFLMDRNYRKQHYGAQAFQMLLQYLDIKEIDLEVLPWNKDGLAFWKHCGFNETCIAMRYKE